MNADLRLANWTPRELPTTEPIIGDRVIVRPADPERDACGLYESTRSGDPALWTYLPYGPFTGTDEFGEWFASHVADAGLQVMAFEDRSSEAVVGCASYMRMEPAQGVIEIGHIFLSPRLQRTAAATEALFLMLRHLLDDRGYRRVEWKCDAANARSMRAAVRLGFTYEGTFRQHRITKGRNRDTAWFSIIDAEWPEIRSAFERWLAPGNFDADAVQIQRLETLRAEPVPHEAE